MYTIILRHGPFAMHKDRIGKVNNVKDSTALVTSYLNHTKFNWNITMFGQVLDKDNKVINNIIIDKLTGMINLKEV